MHNTNAWFTFNTSVFEYFCIWLFKKLVNTTTPTRFFDFHSHIYLELVILYFTALLFFFMLIKKFIFIKQFFFLKATLLNFYLQGFFLKTTYFAHFTSNHAKIPYFAYKKIFPSNCVVLPKHWQNFGFYKKKKKII